MTVQRVTLSASDDKYAPATREIDITVIGNEVFISVFDGSLEDLTEGRKRSYEVPPLDYNELMGALAAFNHRRMGP